ncbi:hypothetical protein GXW82_14485 [Streptacidiphilus sp. 4-A2]|nr:hypothetical protein [Streptacidiphilus sp. 4-A2]
MTTTGRVVDASGNTHYGRPQQSDHPVLVLLSDEDVRRLTAPTTPPVDVHPADPADPADPPQRRATLLDQGLPAGTVVTFHKTDGILHEIDAQLRGPGHDGELPSAALPFANTFAPHNLSAHYPTWSARASSTITSRRPAPGAPSPRSWSEASPGSRTGRTTASVRGRRPPAQ